MYRQSPFKHDKIVNPVYLVILLYNANDLVRGGGNRSFSINNSYEEIALNVCKCEPHVFQTKHTHY